MYSACKLNKLGDNTQPWCTPFPIWNQSIVPCSVLTAASWPAYTFLRRQDKVVWYSHLFKNFPQIVVIHPIKGFNEAEVDVFLEFPCFLYNPTNVRNLISDSSTFYKSSLYTWKFSVLVLLKPSLKNFEHNLTSMGSEHNCPVVWTFFSTALVWDWNENWPFPALWPLLGFSNLLTYWVQHFNSIIFYNLK